MPQASQSVVRATPDDAVALSTLAQRAYFDHFRYLWTDGGEAYVRETFATDRLRQESADDNVRHFMAWLGNRTVGYVKLNLRAPLDGVVGLELHRIYLLAVAAGQGIGRRLVAEALRVAAENQRPFVWLKVMRSSRASIAFYEKRGFRSYAETTFAHPLLKPEYQDMLIMKKAL